jgi:hypothetical protein
MTSIGSLKTTIFIVMAPLLTLVFSDVVALQLVEGIKNAGTKRMPHTGDFPTHPLIALPHTSNRRLVSRRQDHSLLVPNQ